jgi:hypothetical protein
MIHQLETVLSFQNIQSSNILENTLLYLTTKKQFIVEDKKQLLVAHYPLLLWQWFLVDYAALLCAS